MSLVAERGAASGNEAPGQLRLAVQLRFQRNGLRQRTRYSFALRPGETPLCALQLNGSPATQYV